MYSTECAINHKHDYICNTVMECQILVERPVRVLHDPDLILQLHVPIHHLSPVDMGGVDNLQSPIPMSIGIPGTKCRPRPCSQSLDL